MDWNHFGFSKEKVEKEIDLMMNLKSNLSSEEHKNAIELYKDQLNECKKKCENDIYSTNYQSKNKIDHIQNVIVSKISYLVDCKYRKVMEPTRTQNDIQCQKLFEIIGLHTAFITNESDNTKRRICDKILWLEYCEKERNSW
jgi:hypothetical protein